MGTRDICLDEPFTIFHAQQSVWDILQLPSQNEPNPPFFMLLLHFWIKIFGIGAFSVRILPLLFNASTSVILYFIGKKFFSLWSGILASGLFIFSTYHFYFGLETRTYSLLSLATAAALYYFLSLINNPENKKFLIALIIANFVLIYSHFFGWFVIFVQFLISFIYIKNKQLFKTLLKSIVLTGILFLPIAPIFIKQFFISSKGTWVQPPSHFEYINQLYWLLNSKLLFNIILFIGIGGVIYGAITEKFKNISKEIILVFIWWFVPYTLMFMVSSKVPMFINRYILFNSIGLYLFIGVAINFFYKQVYAYVISIFIVILMYFQLQINSKDFYYREVQNTINHIKTQSDKNSVYILYPHWVDLGFMYYFDNNIYKNVNDYDSLLKKNRIFPVWNLSEAKEYLTKYKNNRVIYYQDGALDDKSIFKYLDSTYRRIDSISYPQCFTVGTFEPL